MPAYSKPLFLTLPRRTYILRFVQIGIFDLEEVASLLDIGLV